jgi:hypothetical protein
MTTNPDKYTKINDVDIVSIILKSDQGGETNLISKIEHISIFEDIYVNCMSGYALVIDAHNMIDHFPIIGQETLTITFRTPGFGYKLEELEFEVHAIDERAKSENNKSEIYKLSFISKEYRLSKISRINQPLTGRISDMVKSLIEGSFPESKSFIIKTLNEYKYVIPNWTPMETINWLAERSSSDVSPHNSNYLFFQNKRGYMFCPLGSLSVADSNGSYVLEPGGIGEDLRATPSIQRQWSNIQDIKIINNFDRLSELDMSTYSSNLIVHDVMKKSYTSIGRKYISNFDDTERTEKYPILPKSNRYSMTSDAIRYLHSRQTNMYDDYENTQDYEDWLLKRKSTLGEYDSLKLKITVAGNSALNVGDCVDITIPSNEPMKSIDADWYDKYLSGKYLITSLRHSINVTVSEKEYTCIMELSRCSNSQERADDITFLGKGKNNSDNKGFIK